LPAAGATQATVPAPTRYKQAEEKRQRHNDNEIFAA